MPNVPNVLGAGLRWALEHGSEAYTVLNACRALAYLDNGHVISKVDGAQFALKRGGPLDLINEALIIQQGTMPDRAPPRGRLASSSTGRAATACDREALSC